MAVAPSAVAQGKFYVSTNAAPAALAGENCNPLYFNAAYQNDNLHEAMGEYANRDYKKMFILAPNYPAGKDSLTGFKRYYKGELASEIYTQVGQTDRSEEHTSELQSLMRISYAVFCLKKKNKTKSRTHMIRLNKQN